jgi:hypothetical protein
MRAAIYARVSTDRRGRDQTIDSQVTALRRWAEDHGHELLPEHVFTDDGYSGSRLDRPALDRLRDAAFAGEFDVLAVHSPDRLARRYAYQVLLMEEFRRAGCAVEFVERPISDDPHDQLLLQIQGRSPSTSGPSWPSGSAAASSRRPAPASGSPAAPPTAIATSPSGTGSPGIWWSTRRRRRWSG